MAMLSTYWLVAGRRRGLAVLEGPRTAVHGAKGVDVPGPCSRPECLTAGDLTLPLFS